MSFSCIAFLRGFFDDNHFKDGVFGASDNKTAESGGSGSKKADSGLRIKLIKPHCSPEADGLLSWLNGAIAESLEARYLRAVNLSVVLDPNNPSDLFESYCFQISYAKSGPSIIFDTDVTVNPMQDTRVQIHQLLKRFIIITQSLKSLPSRRFLSMQLLFTDDCSSSYCPEQFVDCSTEPPAVIRVPVSQSELFDVIECGFMDSYHHQISTRIMSLAAINISVADNNTPFKEVDPFDFADADTTLVGEESPKTVEMSQISKDLTELVCLPDASSNILDTQRFQDSPKSARIASATNPPIKATINCHCGSTQKLSYSAPIRCTSCHRYSHRACYAIDNSDNEITATFNCPGCQGCDVNDSELTIFMIRRLLCWLNTMDKPLMKSTRNILSMLGHPYNPKPGYMKKRKHQIKLLTEALSLLLHDEIITLKTRKTFFYVPFEIEHAGITLNRLPLKPGSYFINYARNCKAAHRYMDSGLLDLSRYIQDKACDITLEEAPPNMNSSPPPPKGPSLTAQSPTNNFGTHRKKRKVGKSIDVYSV